MADLGRAYGRSSAHHLGTAPRDVIRVTIEAQQTSAMGDGWALFAHCDFTRGEWKDTLEQLRRHLDVHPRDTPTEVINELAEVMRTVTSWPSAEQAIGERSNLEYCDDRVEFRLSRGLFVVSLRQWVRMIPELHAAWNTPGDPLWGAVVE